MPGISGINCTHECPFPTYGIRCQELCNCNKDQCEVATGCSTLIDGTFNLLSNRKFIFN